MELTVNDGFRLVYQSGSEHNPGDPFGAVTLTLTGDGVVTLDSRLRGAARHFRGSTTREVLEQLLAHLRTAGFPHVAPHRIPPGSALRSLTIEANGQTAHTPPTGYHAVRSMPGYQQAYLMLDSITTLVSRNELPIVPSPDDGLATA